MNQASLEVVLDAGIRCHDAGDLKQAEQYYRQVLAADPRHAKATYLMGVLALHVGNYELSVRILSGAIRLDGRQPTFHTTLGEAFRGLGRLDDAVACYRQSLRMNDVNPEAYNNLGTLLQAQGSFSAAIECYRKAGQLNANYAEPRHNLGIALQQQGHYEEAATAFAEAVRIRPEYFEAQAALASMLLSQGKTEEAMARYAELSERHPGSAQLQCAQGAGFQAAHKFDEAIGCYRRAIELAPNYAEAYYNLGTIFHQLDQEPQAILEYEAATRLNPRMAPAWSNLSNAHLGLVRPDEAVAAARQAVALQPRSNTAQGNLATALQLQGDMEGAIAAFRRAIEYEPADFGNHSNLVYTLNFHPGYDDATLLAAHREWAARHAEPLTAVAAPPANDRQPDRRLRVGYVSPHFRHHAVAFFSEPLLAAHDREQFEVVCYADMHRSDETTDRFRDRADTWRDTTRLSHGQLAELVRRDRIDILVDLAGHIGGNRLPAFAHRPAPVQVTYLGYQNTTGMSAMDYRLTDAHADPPGVTDRWYTEKLIRLPGHFFCYLPPERSPPIGPLPSERTGRITFASLNHIHKLRPEALRAWARILSGVPESRFLLLAYTPGVLERNVRMLMAEAGIDPARVEVVNKRPRHDYLKLHDEIDVALDTFPFQGHTTVCDALWMGVPSIMLEGGRYASRFGGSTLHGVGLQDCIAHSVDEYVALAIGLASDRERLADLRRSLRERLLSSRLTDGNAFARDVEAAYRQMWRGWCAS